MDADKLGDAASVTKKAGEHVHEIRDTTDPRYISQLLVTILAGLGRATEGRRIKKRVADEVLWLNAAEPWRRAPLWLIIRVALQTTLKSLHDYKSFMVFLLCRLISEAVKRDVCSDLLFTMRAKVARRFYKLSESPTPPFVDISVETTVRQASRLLQDRWDVIQTRQATSPPWNPASWDLESATVIKLPKAYDYIDRALNRQKDISDQVFIPPNPPHLRHVSDFVQYHEGKLTEAYQAQGLVTLLDFEESIRTYIDSWVEMNLHNSVACEILASCFNQYYSAAKTEYPSHPEDRSIMVLTLMELWMALDKVAATQFPLLGDYTPDIPPTFLHPLLFRHFHFIDRANKIERYILERYRSSKYSSVFTDELTDTSISVIYFRQSQTLQDLKARIERRAETERSAKAAELRQLNQEHDRLTSESSNLSHQYYSQFNRWGCHFDVHSSGCRKCSLERSADGLAITIHEWPLPSHRLKMERLVFEIACPIAFSLWRDVTFNLLCTVGISHSVVDTSRAEHNLHNSDLQSWISGGGRQHITLASKTKQFTRTHYRSHRIPATESDVLLSHASQWHLYDCDSQSWAANRFANSNVETYGTHNLPRTSPYSYLQYALSSTIHTSNQVLAKQAECPSELTLHEHIAFGTLRSGGRTQWLNVMRELGSNALSFEREEVHQLFVQATCQLGPRSADNANFGREWHEILTNDDFLLPLLYVLEALLTGVKANWRQVVTIKTISTLFSDCMCMAALMLTPIPVVMVTRILAYQQHDTSISRKAYVILREARSAAYQWALELEKAIELKTEAREIQEYSQRLLVVAATCCSTYDVDECHLRSTFTDFKIFMHCGFIICRHTPPSRSPLQDILTHDCRLRHRLQDLVVEQIEANRGLDEAIREVWEDFARTSHSLWTQEHASSKYWWRSNTVDGAVVHCNILDGQFLVNGKPLGRLPKDYTSHRNYQRIFGDVSRTSATNYPTNIIVEDFGCCAVWISAHGVHLSSFAIWIPGSII